MRHFCAVLLTWCSVGLAVADEAQLEQARTRWLKGNYEEARALWEKLAREPKLQGRAAIGISRTWESEGEYDKALAVIDDALKKDTASADLHSRRGELLYHRGRWKEAEESAEKAIAIDKDHFAAHWVRAQVCRDRGDHKQADAECRWFVRAYSNRVNTKDEVKDPEALVVIGLAAAENARWHNISNQFRIILNDIWADAVNFDKNYWPAEYHSGMLLLEKHNLPEAVQSFNKVLTINPQSAEALVGKGLAALQKYEIGQAEQFAERALKINPNHVEALRLRADIHLAAGDIGKAVKELAAARKVNPRDERTLGRIAACLLLQRKKGEFDALVQEVLQHNPKPGVFYHELAERLDDRKQFTLAETYFKKASEERPMLPGPHTSLGMLLMRMGREKEARDLLEKAADTDPFNVRVFNMLRVLRHLDKYETIKTDHFEIRFDPKTDRILARYMADRLEEMYAELVAKFNYRPKGLILVEVFNNHEMFSGRVVALPDLHTIGACTGRMFAMVSPHGKGIGKAFNWSRVLRHELVHIFNLEQTDFQCPHWLTEGLAVIEEGYARPQVWNQILVEKVPAGELLNLDNITLAFIRPRSPREWQQAYCQSQLYVEYIESKYGAKAIGDLLAAYRDGLDTAAALQKVCKVDQASFEKGYVGYLQEVVKGIKGRPTEKVMTFFQLRDAHEKDPDDADIAARLAEQFVDRSRNAEARKLAEGVLARNKTHPLANYVKARLELLAGNDDAALKLLETALDRKQPEPKVLQLLGKTYFESKQFARAVEIFELGRKTQPTESQWLIELARVHAQTGDKGKQIEVLKDLVMTDPDDFDQRRRLTRMLLDAGRFADAEKYGRQAMEINILDQGVQDMVIQALEKQGKKADADCLRKILER